jgi:hypothetical protein
MNWPTLYRPPRRKCARADIQVDQVQPAYPTPLEARSNSYRSICSNDFHQVKLAYPAPAARRRHIKTQNPQPLQLPELLREIIGEIEAKDGLPSADRNNKATLLLTGPFRTAKSSAKDLTPLVLKLQYAKYHDALRAPWKNRLLRR